MTSIEELLKLANARIDEEIFAEKRGFTPMGPQGSPPQAMPQGGMPPMGQPPMGGAPPMDPSMMGGAPPMDPSMMGGAPPGGTPVQLTMEDLVQLFAMVSQGGMPGGDMGAGGPPPMPAEMAPNEPEKPKGGKGKAQEGKLEAIEAKLDALLTLLGGGAPGGAAAPPDLGLGGAPDSMGTGAGGEIPPPPIPDAAAGMMPPPGSMPPPGAMAMGGGDPGMTVQAAARNKKLAAHVGRLRARAEQQQNSRPAEKQAEERPSRSKAFRLNRILKNLRSGE